jgi:hypothetical protein
MAWYRDSFTFTFYLDNSVGKLAQLLGVKADVKPAYNNYYSLNGSVVLHSYIELYYA